MSRCDPQASTSSLPPLKAPTPSREFPSTTGTKTNSRGAFPFFEVTRNALRPVAHRITDVWRVFFQSSAGVSCGAANPEAQARRIEPPSAAAQKATPSALRARPKAAAKEGTPAIVPEADAMICKRYPDTENKARQTKGLPRQIAKATRLRVWVEDGEGPGQPRRRAQRCRQQPRQQPRWVHRP